MTTVAVRSAMGETSAAIGEVVLAPELFEAQVNVPVMHQVVVAQMNARRAGTRNTKTRGEVSGGGRKPYRQKGTGRARQGSIRAPHYVGGGTVFGPHPRDYTQKVPRKMRALALRSALSDRAREERIIVVDTLSFDRPRTKDALALLESAGIVGKVLVVLDEPNENAWRSFRNLPQAHMITVDQLNTYDIIAREWLMFSRAALEKLNARAEPIAKGAGAGSKAAKAADGGEGS
jgi:large subunit ribosomal protein L4